MRHATLIVLLACMTAFQTWARSPMDTEDGVGGIRYYDSYKRTDQQEVVPPGGFFLSFMHGPDSSFFVIKTAAGKGRSAPIRVNRHGEETGIIVKGSMLFKAGYNGEFERVLRVGDAIIIPKCVPHSGISGWDHDEETILITTFTHKYAAYGPDNAGKASTEILNKLNFKPNSGPAETEECKNMKDTPKVTWSVADLPRPE